jgi:hypothetical protein
MTYIAAGAAILQLGASYMGAQAAKAASQLEGDEYDLSAIQTLLTARYNLGNIIESGMIKHDSIMEQGADKEALLKRAGKLRLGKTVATIGASGVRMDSGTANQQIIKSGLDNASQILANQEELNAAISGLETNVGKQLEETRVKALNDYNKLKRMAKLAREGGNTGHFATMMTGIAGAAGTYTNLGGNFSEFQTQETGGGIETSGGTLSDDYKPGGR